MMKASLPPRQDSDEEEQDDQEWEGMYQSCELISFFIN